MAHRPPSLAALDDDEPWDYAAVTRYLLVILQYSYPVFLLVFFLIAFTVRSIAASNSNSNVAKPTTTGPGGKPLPATDPTRNFVKRTSQDDVTHSQKLLFTWLSLFAAATFVGNAAVSVSHAVVEKTDTWWAGNDVVVYLIGSFFVYCLFLISLIDSKPSPTAAHLATWIMAAVLEIVLVGLSLSLYTHAHKQPTLDPEKDYVSWGVTRWEAGEVAFDFLRVIILLALIGFYLIFVSLRQRKSIRESASTSETTSLLGGAEREGSAENGHANGSYGSVHPVGGKHQHTEGAPPAWSRPTGAPARSWWEYLKGYKVFFPYLWPSKDRRLQIMVVICFVIVLLQRIVNVLVPDQIGRITDRLEDGSRGNPWQAIMLFIAFRFIQGNNGLLGAIRSTLWIPVGQYSYRELSVAAFEHVHSLSLDFHLGKKTGEVLSALGKGSSINTFLEQVTFQVVPMLVDLAVAVGYFLYKFDATYALVLCIVTFWYIYLTIRMAQWRAEIRREMVNADREEDAVKNDSMVSYETVKYFNAEAYEFNRYRNAVRKFQEAEYTVLFSLNLMNVSQNMVFMLGLLVVCFIAAHQVVKGEQGTGDFVTLVTYMGQLQSPLNFFGTFYRMIQSALINSERMLELFKEQPTVVDKPDAKTLPSCEGELRFNDVHFSYDERKPALTGLDFQCPPGTTTAFVGESGGGKSTVFRLMYRFYNTQSGSIQIDGRDVEDLTIDSVRSHIGVVPQDTVLFNESLMYNLKYANQDATNEEVYAACRAASIHDKIMSFPDQYDTKVGERGLRLSGGEKQRVAIARTILKNPRIIMLDEATAALDTETEQHIQEAFTTLAQGRTMLIIAHRLSTITHADQILVLHKGKVAERGTHEELLEKNGHYAAMWKKQIRAQRAAEQAKALKDKADRLRRESKDGNIGLGDDSSSHSASSSDDERMKKSKAAQRAKDDRDSHDTGKPPGHP
ncbi:ATP-binding cassette-type vacuolar membrane transporter Hmt1 [Didymosphaeria variabile]|uniref:ATP-binding cassette-type vacuolar membrane transporter Hmt1 n=1 Tax=Didymosphaeria variabile TaxID=1932322 RepID=A0A9W9C9Y5_9PLEO|nr:ATP-binding cassette-type vacuolar membrane transporter Hmt1 [Didymosphaeria variabile]KAJ4351850.1 ATP-binding cassette-type vacuolar membrane transporter Hmt1 [Didymosphaeria variabile]